MKGIVYKISLELLKLVLSIAIIVSLMFAIVYPNIITIPIFIITLVVSIILDKNAIKVGNHDFLDDKDEDSDIVTDPAYSFFSGNIFYDESDYTAEGSLWDHFFSLLYS